MRAAPPVSVSCTGGLPWRFLRTGLVTLAAAVLTAWLLLQAGRSPAPAALVALAAGLLAWRATRTRGMLLVWDGQRWTADGTPGQLEVMIDLGSLLLLRLRPEVPGAARWIALTAAEAGAALHGLRSAAYARAAR